MKSPLHSKILASLGLGLGGCLLASGTNAIAQEAVQWRVEDGGNGHWYQPTPADQKFSSLAAASEFAMNLGGHVVTMTTDAENQFVSGIQGGDDPVIILGAYQDLLAPDYAEPSGGWRWVTDEPWNYTDWYAGEPQNGAAGEDCLGNPDCGEHFMTWRRYTEPNSKKWNDVGNATNWTSGISIIEWSADCNNDGIVDYGQILDGTLADDNNNGVPDLCEAVQWRVEDGGNGHWFAAIDVVSDESSTLSYVASIGAVPASIATAEEDVFAYTVAANATDVQTVLLGGRESETPGGFAWLDGTPFVYTNWDENQNQPDEPANEEYIAYFDGIPNVWHDVSFGDITVTHMLVEWSADCNDDGIVDYGQILDGTLLATPMRTGFPTSAKRSSGGRTRAETGTGTPPWRPSPTNPPP